MGQILSKGSRLSSKDRAILPLASIAGPARIPDAIADTVGPPSIRMVVEERKRFYLVMVRITNVDGAQLVMAKALATRDEVIRGINILNPLRDVFWGQRIVIATLSTIRNVESPDPSAPLEVNIRDRDPCPDLDRPDLLDNTLPFVVLYPEVLEGSFIRKAMLVEQKLKRQNVLWCAVVALVFAVIIGMLVGILTHNIGAGVATSGGTVGAVAILVQLSVWLTERKN